MPTYALADLRALTLRRLRASDCTRFSPASTASDYEWIDDAIERAEEKFVRETKCLKTWAIVQLKNGIRTYRLPSDFIDLQSAYYYDSSIDAGYQELDFTTVEKLNDEVSDWRTETDRPKYIYLDRQYGSGQNFGLYPIPNQDGQAVSFSSSYASEVTWICPLYTGRQDFGRILPYNGTDSYMLSSSATVVIDAEVSNYNLLLEYYRLPHQRAEMPPESSEAIASFAAYELLIDNPEDSVEYKRAQVMLANFEKEIMRYIARRKSPVKAENLQAKSFVWSWMKNMQHYKEMP